jgi:hypothetical protein
MRRRLLRASCALALTLAALPGCKRSPSAPSPVPSPRISPFAQIAGDYALTVEIDNDNTCTTFPQALRVRRYDAAVLDKYSHYAPLRVVGGGFTKPFEIGEFFPDTSLDPSRFRFEWNMFDVGGCDEPEPLSESTDLYLCASGIVTRSTSTMTGDIPGRASITGGVREIRCSGSHRFTFVRQAK